MQIETCSKQEYRLLCWINRRVKFAVVDKYTLLLQHKPRTLGVYNDYLQESATLRFDLMMGKLDGVPEVETGHAGFCESMARTLKKMGVR